MIQNRVSCLTVHLLLLLLCFSAFSAEKKNSFLLVFTRGINCGNTIYKVCRIPAFAVSCKNTLLAFCEGRSGSADHGAVDLILRRSTDEGKTWSPVIRVYGESTREKAVTIGNPCVVQDHNTGRIFLFFCRNNRDVLYVFSDTDGVTWSSPVDVTLFVKKPSSGWVATGPGHGIQLTRGGKKGRLLIPADTEIDGIPGGIRERGYSFAIYSDDHGKTWKSGSLCGSGMNECEAVECTDGSVLLSMRNYLGQNARAFTRSSDGG